MLSEAEAQPIQLVPKMKKLVCKGKHEHIVKLAMVVWP